MDYRLLEQCRAGNAAAVEDFVQTYQRDVYCLALSILDNSHEAEDATQESLGEAISITTSDGSQDPDANLSPRLSLFPVKLKHAHL